jgi:hypothetical protein
MRSTGRVAKIQKRRQCDEASVQASSARSSLVQQRWLRHANRP